MITIYNSFIYLTLKIKIQNSPLNILAQTCNKISIKIFKIMFKIKIINREY
jgi:hypothetical protein